MKSKDESPVRKSTSFPGLLRASGGFTLLEMVVSMVILGILGATGATLLTGGLDAYETGREQLDTLGKARLAADRLAWEIRQTAYRGTTYDIILLSPSQFRFVKTDGEIVTVDSSGTTMQLTYNSVGFAAPLLDRVSALTFGYYQADGQTVASVASQVRYVEVSFTASNSVDSVARRVRIALREKP